MGGKAKKADEEADTSCDKFMVLYKRMCKAID